jgi:hypothetical protein
MLKPGQRVNCLWMCWVDYVLRLPLQEKLGLVASAEITR